jgi:hypothetical protein
MKTIIPIVFSCLLLFGCSRKETSQGQAIALSDIATMHVQKRVGSTLEGVHLDIKANGEHWTLNAKEGEMSNEPDGMVHLVLYDVQANLGSKGRVHRARMTFAFRMPPPYKSKAVPMKLPQFEFTAADLVSPARVATNSLGTVTVDFRLSEGKADELRQFTTAHLNQKVEIMFGEKVLMRPVVDTPISDGELTVAYASFDTNAQAVVDLLGNE